MKFTILLTDCMTTSALNEQFIANLVLLRCHPSENASVIEYANFVETQLQNGYNVSAFFFTSSMVPTLKNAASG